jgi:hypothetical protein
VPSPLPPPRRRVLRGLAGGVFASLAVALAPAGTLATHTGCRHTGATCKRADQCCSKRCTISEVCKLCTNASQCPPPPPSQPCQEARCTAKGKCVLRPKADNIACGNGGICCGGTCVDPQADANHCGGCATTCTAPTSTCYQGECVCAGNNSCDNGTICCTDQQIGSGTTCMAIPRTCPPGADFCTVDSSVRCGGSIRCNCFTPLIDGGTRCGQVASGVCGECTIDNDCVINHGTGAFCVEGKEPNCTCNTTSRNFCAKPCP